MQVCDLGVRLGDRWLLRGVSFSLQPGEVLAVIGPNGAGKSTLLRSLSGDRTPTEGRVLFGGRPLTDWSHAELARHRAVLPQHAALAAPLTAREIVALGRMPHPGPAGPVVGRALERLGLVSRADQPYPTLSGGERQRVHLARALAQLDHAGSPRALLLDEPTSALDPGAAADTLALLRAEARRGLGILVVLHDLPLAAAWADRVVILRAGQVVAAGPPSAVVTSEVLSTAYDHTITVLPHPTTGLPVPLPTHPTQEDTP